MTYVITESCSGAKHTNCVDVCPVDAFREGADMLYIDPDECIDCNACLTECPERAIYPESRVPAGMEAYVEINAVESKRHPVITERIDEYADRVVAQPTPANELKRFAVVGAGPSGFFAAEALLKQFPGARIDLIEKLPIPFGLVRYGVAPDHPEMKSVTGKFTSLIMKNPGLNFYGNVEIGKDIQRDDLLNSYDYVIYTTGGSASKIPAIPGVEIPGVYGSSEFVGWYNGHPEHKMLDPRLDAETMVIIGVGNVALDIARIVCSPKTDLELTDIADHALGALAGSRIREVTIVARKGPAQAAFTPKELQELIDHKDIKLVVDAADLELDPAIEASLDTPENSEAKENVALLRSILQRMSAGDKTIRFVFHAKPEEIESDDTGVRALRTNQNKVTLDTQGLLKVETTGESRKFDAGIVVCATGYQGKALEGLQFDSSRGTITHRKGRALLENGELADREYVAGWIKRGASGVIGTNKQCAVNTVKTLVADVNSRLADEPASSRVTLEDLLKRNKVDYFTFADWLALDTYECNKGLAENRPRRKVIELEKMLEIKAADRAKRIKPIPSPEPVTGRIKDYDASQPVQTHYRTCTLCEAMCGIKIEFQGERILQISGDEQDTHSNGHICPKGYALQDLHNDPERLKTPLKRIGEQWAPIDWDEAFEEVGDRIASIQKEHGNDAVSAYWGNPGSHSLDIMTTMAPFRKALGSRNLFTASSLDQMPHQLNAYLMFGHSHLFSIPDIDRTDYMLMIGANPAASNGGLMTAGDVLGRLENIKERGGKLVLVDPRRTETALYASEHTFIRPGTDALFLLGLIQVTINKGLTKPATHVPLNGDLDDLEPLVNSISLSRIAEVTGIPEPEIERIACEFAGAEKAVCYGRMGISTQQFGGLNHWLMQLLNIITGNLDQTGGMMFSTPAFDLLSTMGRGGFGRHHSRVRNLPEFTGDFPATTLADEILTPGAGQIRGFVCIAGNPVISVPNAKKLDHALEQLDFMVSIDFYLNETSRHADIILPPTGPFEHAHYDLV
jgi:NADPH-dependent glutamate synthase beta subunit-like oxidoreductase/formylmethanofuran dehydrogenase subunit B